MVHIQCLTPNCTQKLVHTHVALSSKMVFTRRSTRSRSKAKPEPESEEKASVATLESEATEDESASELEQLTEKVFERLTRQQEDMATSGSKSTRPEVLELTGRIEDPFQLASSLQPKLEETPYFTPKSLEVTASIRGGSSSSLCKGEVDGLLKKTVITTDFERQNGVPPIRGPSKYAREKANKVSAS